MRALALIAVALLCSGCWIVEEIDSGMEVWNQHSGAGRADQPASEDPEPEPNPTRRAAAASGPGVFDQLTDWASKKLEGPPPPPDPMDAAVRCRVGQRELLTSHADCLTKGGRATPL